jgi:protease-4
MNMNFWKVFGASLLAVVVASVASSILSLIFMVGLSGVFMPVKTPKITSQTIVKIDFAESITEAPSKMPFSPADLLSMNMVPTTHLLKVLQGVEKAKYDPNVKGLYLNFTGMGQPTNGALEELRRAIIDFKQSGKFVVAYNEGYSQYTYYLASAADKVYLHPEGHFSWAGVAIPQLFMKGAFDKLGIKAEVFRPTTCKYKSAVEPYIREDMSPENRAQLQMVADEIWSVIVKGVAESRNISPAELNTFADNLDISLPEDALKHKLVDELIYEDVMAEKFAEYGVKADKENDYNIISLGEYISLSPIIPNFGAPAVGVVYAEGQIFDGEGEDNNVYSQNLVELLKRARKDEKIKTVVLRVNSPGGSALASDVIWREVELLRKEKPVIVSMGANAASGGYYISSCADAIIADELTATGSIGVFGMFLEGENLLNKKLGINTDVVKTNPSADFGTGVFGLGARKFSDAERKALLRSVDKVYETFTSRVANGRNLPMEKVLDIAQGRVWSGKHAVEIGLVDANGGLAEAIALAAEKAGITDKFRVEEVLEEPSPIMMLMQSLGLQAKAAIMNKMDREVLEVAEQYKFVKRELAREGVQAYCPYTFGIN